MTRTVLCTAFGNRTCALDDFTVDDIKSVIVVSDINEAWIEKVRSEVKVDRDFFAKHCEASPATWSSILGATRTRTIQDLRRVHTVPAEIWHLDGIFDSTQQRAGRHSSRSEWTSNLSTRISIWRHGNIALLLYDSTAGPLHLPVSLNRGGLVIDDISTAIKQFFEHQWHINAIFDATSPAAFCYLLAASTMQTKLHELDMAAKRLGFAQIRQPSLAIYTDLFSLRQEVEALRKSVGFTAQWMPQEVENQLDVLDHETQHIGLPSATFSAILTEVATLDRFIMESFTLMLSFASLSLSETSAKTSRQAQQLTTLAFIYVPLTFVTGIFGMNIYEINGSAVPAWVPVAALGVTLTVTGIVLGSSVLPQKQKILKSWVRQIAAGRTSASL